jgi:hypothetical protein
MTSRSCRAAAVAVSAGILFLAARADAIPAFARKYGTSCLTCHTIYPKLTPFGEAFRRNGYLFPGVDSDYVKQETVVLGQEANKKTFPNSVWPGSIPTSLPVAFGVNGQAFVIPKGDSTAGRAARPGTVLDLHQLVDEAHLWAGAALDDTITFWSELTIGGEGASVENAQVLFNSLLGPRHAMNLIVGKGFPNVTSFGPHSSYLADQMVPNAPVGQLLGNTSGWQLVDHYTGLELNGVVGGRLDYAVGLNAGSSGIAAPTEDFYGRVGFKLGGIRSDGEGSKGPEDTFKPWAETALHLYAFGYRSNTAIDPTTVGDGTIFLATNDVATTWGVGGRAQLESLELNAGWYQDKHNHGTDVATEAKAKVLWGELSYVLFPWLVPAIRVENISLDSQDATGAARPNVSTWHVQPGVAFLIRPNLKLVAVANWERADGFPTSGAGDLLPWTGGASAQGPITIAPGPGAAANSTSSEFESVGFFFAWAI